VLSTPCVGQQIQNAILFIFLGGFYYPIYKYQFPKVPFVLVLIFIRLKAYLKFKGNFRKYKGNWTFDYFLELKYQNELLTTLELGVAL
jgi:hypothetical protein